MNDEQVKHVVQSELVQVKKRLAKIEKVLFDEVDPDDTNKNELKKLKILIFQYNRSIDNQTQEMIRFQRATNERINDVISNLQTLNSHIERYNIGDNVVAAISLEDPPVPIIVDAPKCPHPDIVINPFGRQTIHRRRNPTRLRYQRIRDTIKQGKLKDNF